MTAGSRLRPDVVQQQRSDEQLLDATAAAAADDDDDAGSDTWGSKGRGRRMSFSMSQRVGGGYKYWPGYLPVSSTFGTSDLASQDRSPLRPLGKHGQVGIDEEAAG